MCRSAGMWMDLLGLKTLLQTVCGNIGQICPKDVQIYHDPSDTLIWNHLDLFGCCHRTNEVLSWFQGYCTRTKFAETILYKSSGEWKDERLGLLHVYLGRCALMYTLATKWVLPLHCVFLLFQGFTRMEETSTKKTGQIGVPMFNLQAVNFWKERCRQFPGSWQECGIALYWCFPVCYRSTLYNMSV